MSLSTKILRMLGWTVEVTVPDYPKAIICVAPHTSNWDFFLCKLAYASVNRKAGFLMKSTWFFFPLGMIFKSMGGIPVERKNKKCSLTDVIVKKFHDTDKMVLAITPEGTRSRTSQWRTGFLRIAMQANLPIELAVLDYKNKHIFIHQTFTTTGDIDADMASIKHYYKDFTGKYPEKFTTE
jgi:1-acyl-sn-glycerol-3-phosphate acyltransferase